MENTFINILKILLLATIVFDFLVLIFVFAHFKRKTKIFLIFFILLLLTIVYELLLWISLFIEIKIVAEFIVDAFSFAFGGWLVFFSLYFIWEFTERKIVSKKIIIVLGSISGILAILCFFPNIIIGDRLYTGTTTYNYSISNGYGYLPYNIYFATLPVISLYILSQAKKYFSEYKLRQIRIVGIGFSIALTISVITLLWVPFVSMLLDKRILMTSSNAAIISYIIAAIGMSFFSSFSAYAILRHRMLDIIVAVKRNSIIWIVYGLFSILITSALYMVHNIFALPIQFTLGVMCVLVLFSGHWLKRLAEQLTKHFIKQNRLSFYQFTSEEQAMLEKTHNAKKSGATIAQELLQQLPVEDLDIFIYDHYAECYEPAYTMGKAQRLDLHEPWINVLREYPDGIYTASTTPHVRNIESSRVLKDALVSMKKEFCVPLYHEPTKRLIGIITFNVLSSKKPLNEHEMAWLKMQKNNWVIIVWSGLNFYHVVREHIDKRGYTDSAEQPAE